MTVAWDIEECEPCGGGGWDYCGKCEGCCEHDRICPACNGNGRRPVALRGMALVAAGYIGVTYYRTRAAAQAAIEAN